MTVQCSPTTGKATARLHEIERHYRKARDRKLSMRSYRKMMDRFRDVWRVMRDRYGGERWALPDDNAGREGLAICMNTFAGYMRAGGTPDQSLKLANLLRERAPWLDVRVEHGLIVGDDADVATEMIEAVLVRPQPYKAGELGEMLDLSWDDRSRLGISTVRAVDQPPKRKARRLLGRERTARWRTKQRKQHERRTPLSEAQPWAEMGMSRRTWYRRGKPSGVAQISAWHNFGDDQQKTKSSALCVTAPVPRAVLPAGAVTWTTVAGFKLSARALVRAALACPLGGAAAGDSVRLRMLARANDWSSRVS